MDWLVFHTFKIHQNRCTKFQKCIVDFNFLFCFVFMYLSYNWFHLKCNLYNTYIIAILFFFNSLTLQFYNCIVLTRLKMNFDNKININMCQEKKNVFLFLIYNYFDDKIITRLFNFSRVFGEDFNFCIRIKKKY